MLNFIPFISTVFLALTRFLFQVLEFMAFPTPSLEPHHALRLTEWWMGSQKYRLTWADTSTLYDTVRLLSLELSSFLKSSINTSLAVDFKVSQATWFNIYYAWIILFLRKVWAQGCLVFKTVDVFKCCCKSEWDNHVRRAEASTNELQKSDELCDGYHIPGGS